MSVLSRSWRRLAHGFHRGERVAAPDEAVAVTGTVEAEATWRGLEPLEPRILLSTATGVTPFAEPDPLGPLQPLSNGPVAEVVGRHVFYNNSAFDGHDAGPGGSVYRAWCSSRARTS